MEVVAVQPHKICSSKHALQCGLPASPTQSKSHHVYAPINFTSLVTNAITKRRLRRFSLPRCWVENIEQLSMDLQFKKTLCIVDFRVSVDSWNPLHLHRQGYHGCPQPETVSHPTSPSLPRDGLTHNEDWPQTPQRYLALLSTVLGTLWSFRPSCGLTGSTLAFPW